jgi:peptidoglycan L-alanyl-D-glutamate endopeptidase CwlK
MIEHTPLKQFPRYPHSFGSESRANLAGVLPALVQVAELAITLCPHDGTVIADGGVRSQATANANAARGVGIANSRHLKQADGFGHAVDLIVIFDSDGDGDKEVYWGEWAKHADKFKAMAGAVKIASALLLIPIRQGCHWDMDGTFAEKGEWDWPHFEDPVPGPLLTRATAEMHRYRAELFQAGFSLEAPGAWAP